MKACISFPIISASHDLNVNMGEGTQRGFPRLEEACGETRRVKDIYALPTRDLISPYRGHSKTPVP